VRLRKDARSTETITTTKCVIPNVFGETTVANLSTMVTVIATEPKSQNATLSVVAIVIATNTDTVIRIVVSDETTIVAKIEIAITRDVMPTIVVALVSPVVLRLVIVIVRTALAIGRGLPVTGGRGRRSQHYLFSRLTWHNLKYDWDSYVTHQTMYSNK
jgi:hypothetical protein